MSLSDWGKENDRMVDQQFDEYERLVGPRRNLTAIFANSSKLSVSSLSDVRTSIPKTPVKYAASLTSSDSFLRDCEMSVPDSVSSRGSLDLFDAQYQAHHCHTPDNRNRSVSKRLFNTAPRCGLCERIDGPIARCFDCAKLLCDICVKQHYEMRMFKGHRVLGLDLDVPDTCNLHLLAPLTAACFTCGFKLCNECLRNHATCQTVSLKVMELTCYEAYQSLVNKVENELDVVDTQLQQMESLHNRALAWKERATTALQALEQVHLEGVKNTFKKAYDYIAEHAKLPELTNKSLLIHKLDTEKILARSEPLIAAINPTAVFDDYNKHNAFGREVEMLFKQRPEFSDFTEFDESFPQPNYKTANLLYNATGYSIFRHVALENKVSAKQIVRAKTMLNYELGFGKRGRDFGELAEPSGIAVTKDGFIAITDTKNNRVQVFNSMGELHLIFGTAGTNSGEMLYPNCIAVCPKTDNYVITERTPVHQVQIYSRDGRFIRRFGQSVIQNPRGIAVDRNGIIIVIECKVMRVSLFDQFGNVINNFHANGVIEFPMDVCVNDKHEIFIVDNRRHSVHVFNYDGLYLRTICENSTIQFPISIEINSAGELVVTDNHRTFNMSFFNQQGEILRVYEGRNRHVQCTAAAVSENNKVCLIGKDCRVFVYNCNTL